ncbi:hypothetical protein CLG96_11395 [Sphingomonas oleivorans]|uniref:ATPase n=1 Tax=Sphingomonas oleivorans TaxID=1735121 RepID=A0A2T5FVH3_9SPHN|nr:hypothetical protein [Sphingomonas oleivorans]PTQ09780.1 hypothetical protein CLG96_11395 [Sphingomonas oleivorans]
MAAGAHSIEPWRDEHAPEEQDVTQKVADDPGYYDFADRAPEPEPSPLERRLPAALFLAAAFLWIGLVAWGVAEAASVASLSPLRLISWIGLASGPLGLLALGWLIVTRNGRGELSRYARVARAMRADSQNLAQALVILSRRIEQSRAALENESSRFLALGDETVARFARIGEDLRGETAAFVRHAELLEGTTAAARADLGILLTDLPEVDARTRSMADLLKASGAGAEARAQALEAQLAALVTAAQAAEDRTTDAAERLGTHLARIEGGGAAAGRRLEDASADMARTVDNALLGATQAVEETRRGIAAQSAALSAMVEQSRAALDRAGADSAEALSRRLDEIGTRIDGFAASLAAQDAASRALLAALDQALSRVEQRFESLGDSGTERTADLAEAIVALTDHAENIGRALDGSASTAETLLDRVATLRATIDAGARDLENSIPASLSRLRLQAERSLEAIAAAAPQAESLATLAAAATDRLGEADALIQRQTQAVDALGAGVEARLSTLREQTEALHALLDETGAATQALVDGAGGQLVDALLRVRDAAGKASDHAREALATAIPGAARMLGDAAGQAMEQALADRARQQMGAIAATAERAVDAANKASERLMRQMLTIVDTSAAVEQRIAEHRDEAERADQQNFSRTVALLIESLNSTAIDVAKILSNEVTDSAWAAYLRGDRGVFTRRAVRLLDSGEAREIARHYGEDAEFREQVNRYVHDFEAMLRRILSTRDGSPLAVTMLSSDMGKLYVALAQAIERLRV